MSDASSPDSSDASSSADGADASTLSDGLQGWWRAEGNATDSAGSNNGTLQGGVTFVAGKSGQAFEFDGTSGDVLIPTSTTLNVTTGYTIAFWIRVAAWPAQVTFITSKFAYGAEHKFVAINANGTLGLGLFQGGATGLYPGTPAAPAGLSSATPLTLNTWHHFAATYNGVNANIYIDGNFDATKVASGNISNSTGPLAFAHDAQLGAIVAAYNTFFAGDLDEIRWYSRALTAAEISSLVAGNN